MKHLLLESPKAAIFDCPSKQMAAELTHVSLGLAQLAVWLEVRMNSDEASIADTVNKMHFCCCNGLQPSSSAM